MNKSAQPLPHPRALAHLGDAVYELWVRELAIEAAEKNHDLHKFTIARVKAETQAILLEALLPELTEDEQDIVRRAQNMPVTSSRRANQALHRKSTGFEALIGYWHLVHVHQIEEQKSRILMLLKKIFEAETQS